MASQAGGSRLGDNVEIPVVLQPMPVVPKIFAYQSFHPVSGHGVAYAPGHSNPQSGVIRAAGAVVNDETGILYFASPA